MTGQRVGLGTRLLPRLGLGPWVSWAGLLPGPVGEGVDGGRGVIVVEIRMSSHAMPCHGGCVDACWMGMGG